MANLAPKDSWNSRVLNRHPLFWPLLPGASKFVESFSNWPDLTDYQNYLNNTDNPISVKSGKKLKVVAQDTTQSAFEHGYEPRIYLKGELQTRTESWHDFFQILVWKLFPKTKALLNELHYHAIKSRLDSSNSSSQRSVLENTLTQYDECGAVIISTNQKLLEQINHFDWHTLFWKHRADVEKHLKCIVFGHAIYEKGIRPYIGMTCHSVLLHVPDTIFSSTREKLFEHLDSVLEKHFTKSLIQTPQDLSPFPLLGMPGWHPENNQENFYHNSSYFRPGRKQKN